MEVEVETSASLPDQATDIIVNKMHGANSGVGSNTFCGSGVVYRGRITGSNVGLSSLSG